MLDYRSSWETVQNNLKATLTVMWAIKSNNPDIHLVKLGTMGEYGTPNIDIEEGFIEIEKNGQEGPLAVPEAAWFLLSSEQGAGQRHALSGRAHVGAESH